MLMKRLLCGLVFALFVLYFIMIYKIPAHFYGKTLGNFSLVARYENVTSFPDAQFAHDVKSCLGDPTTNLTAIILNRTIYSTKSEWNRIKGKCRYLMIQGPGNGRTGNHLFRTASLIGIAYLHGYIPIIEKNHPVNDMFDLSFAVDDISMLNSKVLKVPHSARYERNTETLSHEHNWTLSGYFQSWRYFAHVEHIVRESFRIKKQYLDEAKQFLKKVSTEGVPNVGLHVRRGDMLNMAYDGFSVADMSFLDRAMNFYQSKYGIVKFIVISDGMEWCKQHIKRVNVLFSPILHPISNFALLSLCDHVIVTSGTFGWWGAWLANGTTVYFKGFPEVGSRLYSETNLTDYYPRSWIGL